MACFRLASFKSPRSCTWPHFLLMWQMNIYSSVPSPSEGRLTSGDFEKYKKHKLRWWMLAIAEGEGIHSQRGWFPFSKSAKTGGAWGKISFLLNTAIPHFYSDFQPALCGCRPPQAARSPADNTGGLQLYRINLWFMKDMRHHQAGPHQPVPLPAWLKLFYNQTCPTN